jgi:IS30 family transposase
MITHKKLSSKERDFIAVWRGGGIGVREIARRLKRSPSTISEELSRNRFKNTYVAIHAQHLTEQRIQKARKRTPLKDKETFSYIKEKLKEGWSPEEISGRLKREHDGKNIICHETIYRFIYSENQKKELLWEYLPWKRKKRRKKQGRAVHRGTIPDRVSIHKRPEKINTRKEFGHWEGDTVEGKGHREGIHTEVERVSRILAAQKVTAISSEKTIMVQKNIFSSLPKKARRSTTLDNGKENHLHAELRTYLGMKTYHADPYSSWQRGTNEFHNGLLRRYLPKGTSFSQLTQEELDDIVWELNNRPKKVLQYQTPQEVFNLYLGVRIQS